MFIVFEGGEGTGKTTQIARLEQQLQIYDLPVLITREPGGANCPIAEKIRLLLKDKDNTDMQPKAELFLFLAARAQHVEQIVKPNLANGRIVICDRFFGSTFAYQHFGRGLFQYEEIKSLNNFATGGLIPDLTILLDIDPKIGIKRKGDLISEDRLDSEKLEFHEKVRQGYLKLAASEPNWVVINAEKSIDVIFNQIWKNIEQKIQPILIP
jgi:dTMP kinase